MTNSNISHCIDDFSKAQVLCVGDVMLDRFTYGSVDRISPEAPIPILKIERETTMLGGAGNVLRNMSALGTKGVFISVIGNDIAGKELIKRVGKEENFEPHILLEDDRETTLKKRFIAGFQQLLRTDRESVKPISPQIENDLVARFDEALDDVNTVVLSDYKKGVFSKDLLQNLIAQANKNNKNIVIGPKGTDYSFYSGATILTPNLSELSAAIGKDISTLDEILSAARFLIKEYKIKAILVTRSQDGMTLVQEKNYHHFSAVAQKIFDVSGAGDTVVATLATAISSGAELHESVFLANIAAGVVVGKIGTATIKREELRSAIREKNRGAKNTKLFSKNRMAEQAENWRLEDKKIGFTNGCFDLLHPGHLSLLRQARQACDYLIVGLNSDDSVKRLKGEARPIQSETARADILASLSDVDAVIIFSEDTPLETIKIIRPDVIVKGADYKAEDVVGGDFVKSYGGKIVLASLIQGQSTTSTVKKIASY